MEFFLRICLRSFLTRDTESIDEHREYSVKLRVSVVKKKRKWTGGLRRANHLRKSVAKSTQSAGKIYSINSVVIFKHYSGVK